MTNEKVLTAQVRLSEDQVQDSRPTNLAKHNLCFTAA